MVYQIVWTAKAIESFADNIAYLEEHWTEREIKNFITLLEDKITVLKSQPDIGLPRSKKHPNIRYTVLLKRVTLIYQVKPRLKKVELLLFWNTYRHPAKLKIK